MLTPKDIENPSRRSGYDHVRYKEGGGGRAANNWSAEHGSKPSKPGNRSAVWNGPRRATPEEAAQDYCDYINGSGVSPAPQLKSAGHNGKREKLSDDPEVQAALGVLKDAKGERAGNQGFVYCIWESKPGGGMEYVKIGFSTNPQARIAELQCGNPRKLVLVSMKKGTREDERALHQKYIKQNVLQEWFRPTKELLLEFDLDANGVPYAERKAA
jgi:hypothetical protein